MGSTVRTAREVRGTSASVAVMRRRVTADARRTQHLAPVFSRFLSPPLLLAHYFLFRLRLTTICLLRQGANAAVRPLLYLFVRAVGGAYYTCPSSRPLLISLLLAAALPLLSV